MAQVDLVASAALPMTVVKPLKLKQKGTLVYNQAEKKSVGTGVGKKQSKNDVKVPTLVVPQPFIDTEMEIHTAKKPDGPEAAVQKAESEVITQGLQTLQQQGTTLYKEMFQVKIEVNQDQHTVSNDYKSLTKTETAPRRHSFNHSEDGDGGRQVQLFSKYSNRQSSQQVSICNIMENSQAISNRRQSERRYQ